MPFLIFLGENMNIFDYIENKSTEIGNKIGQNETEEDRELYVYAIFALFSQLFTFGIGFILAYFLNCFMSFMIVTLSFVLLRIGGGGYHCSCFRNCFFTSIFIFFLGTFLAHLTILYPIHMLFLGIFSGIFILPVCPKPSENSPSRGYKGDIKFRKKYRNAFLLLICLNILFIYLGKFLYATSISSGIIIVFIMISDTGETIIENIWKFLDNIMK